jgi:hypothetical protein
LVAEQVGAGTVMPTATDQDQVEVAAVQPHQATEAALQIIDIETFQLTEHRDRDSQAGQAYVLINKVRIYTLPEAVGVLADRVHVHQIMPMTEK